MNFMKTGKKTGYRKRLVKFFLLGFLALLVAFVVGHNIPVVVTESDASAMETICPTCKEQQPTSATDYRGQINYILTVQKAVLGIAPQNMGIPYGRTRGPADLLELRHGLCYDRSWVIEKYLEAAGMHFRHVSLYEILRGNSKFRTYFKQQNPSHALTEVLTEKGWLVIDSNHPFVGLTADSLPVNLEQIRLEGFSSFSWHPLVNPEKDLWPYSREYTYIYGLYSRHGRFYPPYNFIPDYNILQLLENI